MAKKILIIGGVAGGASAAARLRRLDEDAHIIMLERGPYISFANCGLPYYIGGSIQDRSKLLVQTPEAMRQRFNLDIRINSEAVAIDTARRRVAILSQDHGSYEESYDALILSPGAQPIRPALPGIDSPKIMTLRNIPDTDKIKAKVAEAGVRSAIVIGGGFIGVEMAENLREAGLEVTLVEAGPQILAPFDAEMAGVLAQELETQGVHLIFNDQVSRFVDTNEQVEVHLASGIVLASELAVLAIGVTPDTAFLRDSGISLGPRGHILVNERMKTSADDVYAVGDAVEIADFVNRQKTAVPLAGPANKQGRIAADNICGLDSAYKGSQGTAIIKVFGLTGASTGNNEKTLRRLGIPYRAVYVHPQSHASYYPGATPLSLKLLFNMKGAILGAQAVGHAGVDKRIDTIAAVLRSGGTVTDLAELELAYAPPYSSAKDPVNMLGYVAANVQQGLVDVFVPDELARRDSSTTLLVDVRTPLEHDNGRIEGSINIPVDDLRERLDDLDRGQEIWVYCQVGLRGYTAARILQQRGFRVRNLTGGYRLYQMSRYTPQPYDGHRPGPATESGSQSKQGLVPKLGSEPRQSSGASEARQPEGEMAPRPPAIPEGKPALQADATLDACGMCCPGPLIQAKVEIDKLEQGQLLKATATDPGFYEDIQAWAQMSGHSMEQLHRLPGGMTEAYIRKGAAAVPGHMAQACARAGSGASTMVVFSGDLDKAIASFIIANGAAASGKKVTMFFTFWGLNIIRKHQKLHLHKSVVAKMFGAMMPRGSRRLALSKMNMLGVGPQLIRSLMASKNVSSLEELIDTAIAQGVELVACQMSMDLMGISREELLDNINFGGVGYYLGQADQSSHNLFI